MIAYRPESLQAIVVPTQRSAECSVIKLRVITNRDYLLLESER
eukprot:CAMPEP_0169148400 /NCGR_PEP_ID=MMETSP1015-20121227/48836_1 /TAXON_ID=342587 /ORGANISM="Karlodinium micrum, Strain CCMP2283" /LENGTH=42 /DNA_ID= /DNA_START= /DNA_END= /DNA_ORIENTATION=